MEFDVNQTTKEYCRTHGYVDHVMKLDSFRENYGWCCPICENLDLENYETITITETTILKIVHKKDN